MEMQKGREDKGGGEGKGGRGREVGERQENYRKRGNACDALLRGREAGGRGRGINI